MKLRVTSFILGLIIVVGLSACGRTDSKSVKVTKVYDGDTVQLANGEKVRLIGIDTPEAYDNDKLFRDARRFGVHAEVIKAAGAKSSEFTEQLVKNKYVRLIFDQERKDQYGRTLAYVFVPECFWLEGEIPCEPQDSYRGDYFRLRAGENKLGLYVFLNGTLIKAGFAKPYPFTPNTMHAERFEKLAQDARAEERGLWVNDEIKKLWSD